MPSLQTEINYLDLDTLGRSLVRLRGNHDLPPDVSVIVPVHARENLHTVLRLLSDISRYRGDHSLEVILVLNNYPTTNPPAQLDTFQSIGIRVVAIPNVLALPKRGTCQVILRARILGAEAARSNITIHFDADCHVPDTTALVDWYVRKLRSGIQLAYTHVGYYHLASALSIYVRLMLHHALRWVKRTLLRIPTARGSNYAIDRSLLLRLFEAGRIAEDMLLGRATKLEGARIRYSGARRLRVFTSARRFRPGWVKLFRYNRYRLRYNLFRLTGSPKGDQLFRAAVTRRVSAKKPPSPDYSR